MSRPFYAQDALARMFSRSGNMAIAGLRHGQNQKYQALDADLAQRKHQLAVDQLGHDRNVLGVRQGELNETMRSNQAREGLEGRGLDEKAKDRDLRGRQFEFNKEKTAQEELWRVINSFGKLTPTDAHALYVAAMRKDGAAVENIVKGATANRIAEAKALEGGKAGARAAATNAQDFAHQKRVEAAKLHGMRIAEAQASPVQSPLLPPEDALLNSGREYIPFVPSKQGMDPRQRAMRDAERDPRRDVEDLIDQLVKQEAAPEHIFVLRRALRGTPQDQAAAYLMVLDALEQGAATPQVIGRQD